MTNIKEFSLTSGRMVRTDGTIINKADGIQPDGTQKVKVIDFPRKAFAFSTKNLLAANETFFSPTLDVVSYESISGVVKSDQAGTLHFEHSDDGLDWIRSNDSITVPANEGIPYEEIAYEKFIRLVYVNGATAQTSFVFRGAMKP